MINGDRFEFESALVREGRRRIAGVDEVGRGPLAGSVVAAAVVLPEAWVRDGIPENLRRLNDSKQLTARAREEFYGQLTNDPAIVWSVAECVCTEIDRINILRATHHVMGLAIRQLSSAPDWILVDGLPVPALGKSQTAIIKGDSRSYSIAAASVIAKVTRDRQMDEWNRLYPEYGFADHKGYATKAHLTAIAKHGPCPIHRRSFAPMKAREPELFGSVS
jgi:ribonuclease HII